MKYARQFMEPSPRTVTTDTPINDLARIMVEEQLEGVCVVDESGHLIGVVTAMDLIFQEKRPHLPTVFTFMDTVLTFGMRKTAAELARMTGATAKEVMTPDPQTAAPGDSLDHVATLMVERHYTLIPVVEGQTLVGLITKPSVLKAVFIPED
jgi:CBS domain-containing protein